MYMLEWKTTPILNLLMALLPFAPSKTKNKASTSYAYAALNETPFQKKKRALGKRALALQQRRRGSSGRNCDGLLPRSF